MATYQSGHLSPQKPKKPVGLIVGIVAALVVAIAVVGIVLLLDDDSNGAAADGNTDSGIAACKMIAEDDSVRADGKSNDDPMSEAEYKQIRKLFSDSGDKDIRENGVKIIDIAWEIQQLPEDQQDMAAFARLTDLVAADTQLAIGCARHGITIPTIGSD